MNGQILSIVMFLILLKKISILLWMSMELMESTQKSFLVTPLEKGTSLDIAFTLTNIVDGVPTHTHLTQAALNSPPFP